MQGHLLEEAEGSPGGGLCAEVPSNAGKDSQLCGGSGDAGIETGHGHMATLL